MSRPILHVLSGDSLLGPFQKTGIDGDVAVFRECLVDGPIRVDSSEDLFACREEYLSEGEDDLDFYRESVRPEIRRVLEADSGTETCMWFEHELFCQVNLWYLIASVRGDARVSIVSPPEGEPGAEFAGWAVLDPKQLTDCFDARIDLSKEDRELGSRLWEAFADGNNDQLTALAKSSSRIFRYLDRVAIAATEKESLPERFIRGQFKKGNREFVSVFQEFCKRHPVFGFGDLQFERIWNHVSGGLNGS